MYLMIIFGIDGEVRWGRTDNPEVPEHRLMPGEAAFVIQPLDFKARHMHTEPIHPDNLNANI